MYRPFAFEHLIHPETTADGRIKHPFRVGLSNAIAGMIPVLIAAAGYLWKYQALSDYVAWFWLVLIPTCIVIVAFAHAYLGSLIGGSRANNIFVVLLLILLVAGCWLLTRYTRGEA